MKPKKTLLSTFKLEETLYGINVESVQEILRSQKLTKVPGASAIVGGLINLRGNIIPAIDVRRRLGSAQYASEAMNVVLRTEDGPVSLLVDSIGDVVEVEDHFREEVPPTLTREQAELIDGVYKLEGKLLHILNIAAVLNTDQPRA